MFKDLTAYTPATPPQGYPPFINISEGDDGTVRVIVRSALPDGQTGCPVPSEIILPRETATELFLSAAFKLTFCGKESQ